MLIEATELIGKSWNDYKAHWHEWFTYSLLTVAPFFIIAIIAVLAIALQQAVPSTAVASSVVVLLVLIAGIFFAYWTTLALIHSVGNYLRTSTVQHWREHFALTSRYLWPVFYTAVIVGFAVLFASLLFLIPGIIIGLWFTFYKYAIVLDNKKGTDAMSYSQSLVVGRWWGTWWRLFVPGLVYGLAAGLLSALLSTPFEFMNLPAESLVLVNNLAQSVSSAAIAPITVIVIANLYLSLQANPVQKPSTTPPSAPQVP